MFAGFFVDRLAFAFAGGFFDGGEDAGGLIGAHDGAFGAGPGEGEEGVESPAAHGVVSRAVGAAGDEDDFGDDGIGHGVDHFGAGADDAALFGVSADHEACGVVEEEEGDLALVAVHDEAGGFVGGVVVDDAGHLDGFGGACFAAGHGALDELFLVGEDPHRVAADFRVAADDGLAVIGFVFVEVGGEGLVAFRVFVGADVDEAFDDGFDVVLDAGFVGEEGVEVFGGAEGRQRRTHP